MLSLWSKADASLLLNPVSGDKPHAWHVCLFVCHSWALADGRVTPTSLLPTGVRLYVHGSDRPAFSDTQEDSPCVCCSLPASHPPLRRRPRAARLRKRPQPRGRKRLPLRRRLLLRRRPQLPRRRRFPHPRARWVGYRVGLRVWFRFEGTGMGRGLWVQWVNLITVDK